MQQVAVLDFEDPALWRDERLPSSGARPATRRKAEAPARPLDEGEALIQRLVDGERGAWNRFVALYARVVYAAVHRRLVTAGRLDEVEDVAQDVFLKICRENFKLLRNYDRNRAKLTTWLTVIATTTSIDHLRRRSLATTPIDKVPEAALSVEPRIAETVEIPADLLSARQALIIELLYRREMEVIEVARLLGIEPQTVRSTHHKAMEKLRAHFKEECP